LGPALAAFAEGKLPGAGAYVTDRLRVYDAVIFAAHDERSAAFELVQDFDVKGTRFVYLGPLFSRLGASLRLFAWYVGRLAAADPDRPLYLAAAVQNPEVLLTLYTLFPHSALPRTEDGGVPPDVRAAAEARAEKKRDRSRLTIRRIPRTPFLKDVLTDWMQPRGKGRMLFCKVAMPRNS
jgi:hypothetical protein